MLLVANFQITGKCTSQSWLDCDSMTTTLYANLCSQVVVFALYTSPMVPSVVKAIVKFAIDMQWVTHQQKEDSCCWQQKGCCLFLKCTGTHIAMMEDSQCPQPSSLGNLWVLCLPFQHFSALLEALEYWQSVTCINFSSSLLRIVCLSIYVLDWFSFCCLLIGMLFRDAIGDSLTWIPWPICLAS